MYIKAIPKGLVKSALALRRLVARYGFSHDALEVVAADSHFDPRPAAEAFGISLTGIDDMIRKSLEQN